MGGRGREGEKTHTHTQKKRKQNNLKILEKIPLDPLLKPINKGYLIENFLVNLFGAPRTGLWWQMPMLSSQGSVK